MGSTTKGDAMVNFNSLTGTQVVESEDLQYTRKFVC
jgi:hypothetical protein